MIKLIIDFIALILAVDATISALFYGSIFESIREKLEKKGGFIGELVGCSFCFTYHVSLVFTLLFFVPAQLLPPYWNEIPRTVLYVLACTDAVHWLQGDRPIPEEDPT